jgi:hypothetical protein
VRSTLCKINENHFDTRSNRRFRNDVANILYGSRSIRLSTRDIKGEYELEQWEDGSTYYLKGPSALKHQAWGAIEGTVGRIGWSGDTIIVWQNDCGSGEGWRIIDTKKKVISPIVSQERIDKDPSLKTIEMYTATEAWKKLD